MSRRKQAKPRSLKRDEEWEDGMELGRAESFQDGSDELDTIKRNENDDEEEEEEEDEDEEDEEEEDEEEELQRAFIHSNREADYVMGDGAGGSQSIQDAHLENENSLDSDALGTGSSSWHSEDGGANSRRGGETPSSCATPTSAISFPSEPEVDNEIGSNNADGNNPAAPYPCQFCDRTFPRLSYLKKHEQSHGDQMPYRCSWCARLFKHKRSRDRHVKLHTGDRRYRCSHCEAAFSRSDHLKIHMKTHDNQKPYQCTACSRGYNTAAALTSHMQSHKNKHQISSNHNNTRSEMDYGGQSVSSHSTSSPPPLPIQNSSSPILNLNINVKNNNSLKCQQTICDNDTRNNKQQQQQPLILNSPLKLACMYCTKDSFTSMQQLQMHVHAMHLAILNGSSLTIDESTRLNQPSSLDEANNSTKVGDKECLERNVIISNVWNRVHHHDDDESYEKSPERGNNRLEKKFSCGQCTMKFSNLSEFRDHLLTIHRKEGYGSATLMMCPLCGIPCASAASYAEHYVLQHCENNHRLALKKDSHNRDWDESNNDGRKNDSLEADDGMTRRSEIGGSLEPADLTKKDPSSSTRPARSSEETGGGYTSGTLLCGQCGAALKDFESFRQHLARHLQADQQNNKPAEQLMMIRNPCPKCGTNFPDRQEMLTHLMMEHYLGQVTKEYTCGACQKCYSDPELLQRHLLDTHAHHLYRCAICRDTFDTRVALQVHFAVKHSHECQIYRCNACGTLSNENSPGNSPGANNNGRNYFRSEAEMANHVRTVHAPAAAAATILNESCLRKSPVSTTVGHHLTAAGPRCVFCGIFCNTDLELQLHLASHSTSLYRCQICREGFPVEFLLERHVAQAHHHRNGDGTNDGRENGRIYGGSRPQDQVSTRRQKRGRSPASSNNNSLNQRDNNNKRPNYNTPTIINGTTSMISDGGSSQQCELCDRAEFSTEAELEAHKKLVHTGAKLQSKSVPLLSMTCAYCGEVCRSRSDLESHTRIQHASSEPGGRHKCNICDEVCPSGGILAEHKLQTHCKIQLSDICVVCRGSLSNEGQFIEHVHRHSLEGIDQQQQQQQQQQRFDNSLGFLPAACVVCRQTLITDLECRLHAGHHLRGVTKISTDSPSPSGRSKLQQTEKKVSLSCCLCLREFSVDEFVSLPSGNSSGTGGSTLRVCKSCYVRHSQGLPILSSPYEHVRRSNKSEIRASWSINGKDLINSWESSSRDQWDNDRCYKSAADEPADKNQDETLEQTGFKDLDDIKRDTCVIKFENSEEQAETHRMKEHTKNSDGSNTYTCIQCQMSFPTEDKIQQHVRRAHLESRNKASIEALRCHLCVYEANSPLQLQGHLIEHTFAGCVGLTCYICQGLFTTPIALQNHMLQQHGLGARPYDCSYCSLKFFFRIELDHHVVMIHRRNETSTPPAVNMAPEIAMENRDKSERNEEIREVESRSKNVTVKEEIIVNSPEGKDANADEDPHQSDDIERNKREERDNLVERKSLEESIGLSHDKEKYSVSITTR